MNDKTKVMEEQQSSHQNAHEHDDFDRKIASLTSKIDVVREMFKKLIRDNLSLAQSQYDYQVKYNELSSRYDEA